MLGPMSNDQPGPSRRPAKVFGLLAALCAAALVGSSPAPPAQTPACIQSWPEVRVSGSRYDHIVHVSNACAARAVCAVSSDVTPTPVRVEVAAGETVEVTLARDSVAGAFEQRVECGLVS
jgi:hypothetical protein